MSIVSTRTGIWSSLLENSIQLLRLLSIGDPAGILEIHKKDCFETCGKHAFSVMAPTLRITPRLHKNYSMLTVSTLKSRVKTLI